jgi:hypothetical protein
MQLVARIFATADQARDAATALEAAGYGADVIHVMTASSPPPAAAVEGDEAEAPKKKSASKAPTAEDIMAAVGETGNMELPRAMLLAKALKDGKSVVIVGDLVGYFAAAEEIMSKCGAEPGEALRTPKPDNPSPFSDFIGMPCLENRLSFFSGENPLKDSNWLAFPLELKNDFTLFKGELMNDPAPLSAKIGFKPLSEEKPWKTSFGFKLLSNQQD